MKKIDNRSLWKVSTDYYFKNIIAPICLVINVLLDVCFSRHWEGHCATRAWRGDMWRRSSHQELPCQHITSPEEHPLSTQSCVDRLPFAEQPYWILVHGGLCQAGLSRHASGIQQHVWATDSERAVHRQHASRCSLDALPQPRAAQPAGGFCSKVNFVSWTVWEMDQLLDATLSIFYVFFLFLLSVNRRGHDVLRDQLPSKQEHVILVRLSPIQRALYTEFMKRFREAGNTGWLGLNPLKAFCVCCKVRRVYIHPSSNQFFLMGTFYCCGS